MIWYILKLVVNSVAVWVHGRFLAVTNFCGKCNVLLRILPIANLGSLPRQVQVQLQMYNAI